MKLQAQASINLIMISFAFTDIKNLPPDQCSVDYFFMLVNVDAFRSTLVYNAF